ncbi:hypothetical protein M406DRAFT_290957 [Cryphonectria parasitica EP155]|uniref:YAG7-like dimerisation domain-containing protein n=1 Tax=Cryphonectria parasitica (strain ATCC 38755 / EP155) TaxID=660469 RepID=A0A9P4Y3X3_CRYP1|nr:uncharacterized protein M406DRAFT_290957 [Cryphonectria parasitica EP155]KAF3766492.1 hypothetical protein M406DRAFT_290957 [Cryphonectria parasitica EP155]
MPASTVQNPPAQTESKSAKKKKAKAAVAATERNDSPAPGATSSDKAVSVAGGNEATENAYIRDLKKNIRNTSKKISNASKTEALIKENKDKSIEQLITAKIINADQKRQVDNKPALEAELARYEEQLAQVQKLDDEWRAIAASTKADTEKALTDKFEKEKADAIAEVKKQAEADLKKAVEDGFLVVSQFLRLVAQRRGEAPGSEEELDKANEGILASVYGGDSTAVASMVKLYHGTDDATTSVTGESLQVTYATIKQQITDSSPVSDPTELPAEEPEVEPVPTESSHLVQTDPTIANAGLTEIDAGTDIALANGHTEETPAEGETSIPNADVGDSAANAAAENQWDVGNDLAASQEWVEVQKPAEAPQTETAPNAPPAAPSSQSWADDHPEPSTSTSTTDANDGFQSVQRNRGRGDREGGFRGGRGGHHRGRGGFRGDGHHRGRGRGGPRGGHRGGFRREEHVSSA